MDVPSPEFSRASTIAEKEIGTPDRGPAFRPREDGKAEHDVKLSKTPSSFRSANAISMLTLCEHRQS
jgi:hypothetical protein